MIDQRRDRVVCQMRVRNEARWIARSLERTFQVARTIVLWDDGSDDATEGECLRMIGFYATAKVVDVDRRSWGWRAYGDRDLHYIKSPFRPARRESQNVSEIRDKNSLWEYVKAQTLFDYVLCLDGDEMLSRSLVRNFPRYLDALDHDADIVQLPFCYLWDGEDRRRVDGIYGTRPDGTVILNFPRLFTVKRVSEDRFFSMRFAWEGSRGGFHCGSVPMENFRPAHETAEREPVRVIAKADDLVIHWGYLDDALRRSKFEFYNRIDPGNLFEGEYKHIIGEPDHHAPGPVEIVPWSDD